MYQFLHDQIREEDTAKIIFYEGVTWDIWPIGFTSTPGGEEYDDRQVLSFLIFFFKFFVMFVMTLSGAILSHLLSICI